jgi:spore coat polysaccharide biosynthesis predicted glycosyltransferase SpsG
VRRILISLGLTDLGGITEQAVRAVLQAAPGVSLDVVLGTRAPSRPAVELLMKAHAGIGLHIDATPADMCRLMTDADLAVGAAGSTSWERCCLGLPTVMVVLAENQRMICRQLAGAGAAIATGPAELSTEVDAIVRNLSVLAQMSARAAEICDGMGAKRVADAISHSLGKTALPR